MRKYNVLVAILFVVLVFPGFTNAQKSIYKQTQAVQDKRQQLVNCDEIDIFEVSETVEIGPITISRERYLIQQSQSSREEQEAFLMEADAQINGDAIDNSSLKGGRDKCESAAPKQISVQELKELLNRKDFLLINVHVPYAGDIPQTDLSIPFNRIDQYLNKLPHDKNMKIVVYCRSGNMSAEASQKLAELGFTNVYDVSGGMKAWKEAGNELVYK